MRFLSSKLLIYLIGLVVTVICFGYLGIQFKGEWAKLASYNITEFNAVYMLLAAACIFSSALVSTTTWWFCLRAIVTKLSLKRAINVSFVSQIAKYVPGNIAHHVGKAALSVRYGVPVKQFAISSLGEIFITVLAALWVALLAMAVDTSLLQLACKSSFFLCNFSLMFALMYLYLLGIPILLVIYSEKLLRLSKLPSADGVKGYVSLAGALQILNFVLLGTSFNLVALALNTEMQTSLAVTSGIFSLAWVAGFLMPGSPGGLGVREAVLVFLLAPILGLHTIVLVSITHRLLSIIMDIFAFVLGNLFMLNDGDIRKQVRRE